MIPLATILASTLCTLGAIALIVFALWRRSADKCPQCAYPRISSIERCPECGERYEEAARKRRWRQRRRLAVSALLLLVAGAFGFASYILRDYPKSLPDQILVRLVPIPAQPTWQRTPLLDELFRRRAADEMGDSVFSVYMRRFLRAGAEGGWLVQSRSSWPDGIDPRIEICREQVLWPIGGATVEFVLQDGIVIAEHAPRFFGHGEPGPPMWEESTQPIPRGRVENGKLSILVRAWLNGKKEGAKPDVEHELALPVKFADSINEILTPVPDPLLNFVSVSARQFRDDYVLVDIIPLPLEPVPDVAIGLRLELLVHGRVVDTRRYWLQWSTWAGTLNENDYRFMFTGSDLGLWFPDLPPESVSVRVVSEPEMALRDFERSIYWEGELTIPVTPNR